jgi:hypothetical protein
MPPGSQSLAVPGAAAPAESPRPGTSAADPEPSLAEIDLELFRRLNSAFVETLESEMESATKEVRDKPSVFITQLEPVVRQR